MSSNTSKIRYHGLDHLRGLLAFGIVCYHFLKWQRVDLLPTFQAPLNLLGYYAVSTFYVISGAALYIVYRESQITVSFLRSFFIKRGFRIIPLFWFVTFIFLSFDGFRNFSSEPYRVFLNFSLLFSWLAPAEYLSPGTWSIGNELAFYSVFPILLVFTRSGRQLAFMFLLAVVVSVGFSEVFNRDGISDRPIWSFYVHPLNQVVFFVGGLVVGATLQSYSSTLREGWAHSGARCLLKVLGGLSLALFLLISFSVSLVDSTSGFWKVVLTLVCMSWGFIAGVFGNNDGRAGKVLSWLGAISYSLYLLHPIVYRVASIGMLRTGSNWMAVTGEEPFFKLIVFISSMVGSLVLATLSFHFLELPMMRFGKKLTNIKKVNKSLS